jgi:cytochrome c biogenesis protein CcdA
VFLLVLVVSVAAVDALNPSTVLPALLYALTAHARRDVALFTAGVFTVSTVGGLALVFGPGRGLLRAVSHPSKHTVDLVEAAAGVLLVLVAGFLWLTRAEVARRLARERVRTGNSALFVGAAIMATELPTALPYFGTLVAITEGAHGAWTAFALVMLYNVVFVAPLLALLAIVVVARERGATFAARMRSWLIAQAPVLLPALLGALGVALILAALV